MSNFHRKTLIITIQKFCNSLDIDDCDGLPPLPQPPPPPPPSPPLETHSLSPLILFMICSLAATFSFICYIATIKIIRIFRNRRRGNINEAHQDYVDSGQEPVVFHPIWLINTIGLDQSVIDSIEIFKYRKKDGLFMEGGDSDCAICLGEFQDDESLRNMPKCSHSFHVACIDTWLRSHKNCPVCRAPVVKNSSIHHIDQNSIELNPQEDIPIGHVENEMTRTEIEQEINTNVESLETKSLTSGVRVQSDLTDRFFRRPEPMKRSISLGTFCFVDQELAEPKKVNVVEKSAKRQGSSSKNYLFGPSPHN